MPLGNGLAELFKQYGTMHDFGHTRMDYEMTQLETKSVIHSLFARW